MRVRTLCGYTVVVESGLARQLLDVLPWRRLMKVATEARCRLVCRVVRTEPANLAKFPMNPIDCYTLRDYHAHFLLPEVERNNCIPERVCRKYLLEITICRRVCFQFVVCSFYVVYWTNQTKRFFVCIVSLPANTVVCG